VVSGVTATWAFKSRREITRVSAHQSGQPNHGCRKHAGQGITHEITLITTPIITFGGVPNTPRNVICLRATTTTQRKRAKKTRRVHPTVNPNAFRELTRRATVAALCLPRTPVTTAAPPPSRSSRSGSKNRTKEQARP
jgi:hypothetical protein